MNHPRIGDAAALATRRPALHVFASSESVILGAARVTEAVLGPLPQADTFEPSASEPWEWRCDLPDLTIDAWVRVADALHQLDVYVELRPELPRGLREAIDLQVIDVEAIHAGPVVARMYFDSERGAIVRPDCARRSASEDDVELMELATELELAVRSVDPALTIASDRGPGRVQPVVHRSTGRFGVELFLPNTTWVELPGDEVALRREQLVAALGRLIEQRVDHPVAPIAPDLVWDQRLGLAFIAWIVAPSVSAMPGDAPIEAGQIAEGSAIAALASQCEGVELEAVPESAEVHERMALRIAQYAEGLDLPLRGANPRWVGFHGASRFAAAWEAPPEAQVAAVAHAWLDLDGVRTVRVVPHRPFGLEDWEFVDAAWVAGKYRWFLRAHQGRTDRDTLPATKPRALDAEDGLLLDAAVMAIDGFPGAIHALAPVPPSAVHDSSGRRGLEFRLSTAAARADVLMPLLDALANHPLVGAAALGTWGWRSEGGVVQLWQLGESDEPPVWA